MQRIAGGTWKRRRRKGKWQCHLRTFAALSSGILPLRSVEQGAEPLIMLLGPATAALAIPLYKHREIVIAYFLSAISGLICGAIATLSAAVAPGVALGFAPIVVWSIGIKSVTAPIAVELAPLVGGDPALTVALVVATGGTAIAVSMVAPVFIPRLLQLLT
jgi:putative effector of murein hydrolase